MAGGGPVPVRVVRSLLDDAFVTAVVSDGVDVSTVAHLGRRPTAHQRSALEVRDPECVVGGCHVRVGLEIDHVEPWSATRVTKLDARPGCAGFTTRRRRTRATDLRAGRATGAG